MWRLLCLLLAFVAPSQAAIHYDGFEAHMPTTEWRQILGPTDGAASATVLVPHNDAASINNTVYSHVFDNGGIIPDFPTTPVGKNSIVGVEFRIKARASHPGVCVTEIEWAGFYAQAGGSGFYLYSQASQNVSAPDFDIGGEPDLSLGSYVDVGGYAALIPRETIETDGDVSQSMNDSQFWLSDDLEAPGEPLNPYILNNQSWLVRFRSLDGYDATLLIDSIHVRLHYSDASTAAMSGGGTMSATLLKAKSMASAMSGSGACAATLNAGRNIYSDMIGTGKITPVISRDDGSAVYRYLMPEMIGTGVVTLTQPIRYGTIQSNMVGSGDIVASISHGKNIMAPSRNGTLALRGSGTIAHTLRAKRPIVAAISGSGTLSGGPVARRPISTALAGSGTASASMIAQRAIASAMTGSGVMAETLQAGRVHPGVAMTGAGGMSTELLAQRPLVAAMQATGLLSADLIINSRLPAPDGRTFVVPESEATFIAPDDFLTFEAQE